MLRVLPGDGEIYQVIRVPSGATYLRFSYWITGAKHCGEFLGELTFDAGALDWVRLDICNTSVWTTQTIDLTNAVGQDRTIYFYILNTTGGTVFLDDIGFVSGPTRLVDYY